MSESFTDSDVQLVAESIAGPRWKEVAPLARVAVAALAGAGRLTPDGAEPALGPLPPGLTEPSLVVGTGGLPYLIIPLTREIEPAVIRAQLADLAEGQLKFRLMGDAK